ncbi:hypothetical protein F4604DRAFT_1913193 [Suillus subluteus]|nr:hypothetical protein F4604DRAFT_1913193 [Suillus subluteus]
MTMMIPTDPEVELLSRSVPIWPTQLRQYTKITLPESLSRDYNVQKMQIDLAWFITFISDNVNLTTASTAVKCAGIGRSLFIHQELYTTTMRKKTYTGMNVRDCSDEQLQRLESWITASRTKLDGKQWLLVVEPILARGKEVYPYYYVVPENRIITWVEPVDGYLLFQECTTVWNWSHKKALALEQSTAGLIFWTLEQMKEITAELATTEELAGHDGVMEEQGVAICGKLLHVLRHHEYLNHHGQPEARLMRTHSLGERRRDLEQSPFMTAVAVAMLWIPIIVLKRLRKIYVDGLVNGVDMKGFIDDFSTQAKSQTTVASVIMAVDASILAIPVSTALSHARWHNNLVTECDPLTLQFDHLLISAVWI